MERVGMPPSQRIAATAASSGFAGFVIGFYRSSRAAGLQYLAENAHSLPRNLSGWYFYHKTKNYRIAYGGIKGGVKLGTRVGIWSALYGVIEATVDYSINRTGLVGSVSAGAMTAAIFASYYKLPRRSARLALAMGVAVGVCSGAIETTHKYRKKNT